MSDSCTLVEKGAFIRRMYRETGVSAVVIIASQLCDADEPGEGEKEYLSVSFMGL